MTADELYAMEAETGLTSEWEPLYRAEKARADDLADLADDYRALRDREAARRRIWERQCLDREAERDEARAVVARVRALHQQYRSAVTDEFDICTGCTSGMTLVPYPCATIRELDAP